MSHHKKISTILTINLVGLLCLASLAHPAERHFGNTLSGPLHEGPGEQYKVIKALPGDQSFEVLETINDFIHIRTKDGSEGWLQNNPTAIPAAASSATDTNERVDVLPPKQGEKSTSNSGRWSTKAAPVNPLDGQTRKELPDPPTPKETAEIKRLQAELGETTYKFEQLEAASLNAQELKSENDRLQAELAATNNTVIQLQQANLALTKNKNIYWFMAGGAVLLLGWLLGRITLRRQRHSSLTL